MHHNGINAHSSFHLKKLTQKVYYGLLCCYSHKQHRPLWSEAVRQQCLQISDGFGARSTDTALSESFSGKPNMVVHSHTAVRISKISTSNRASHAVFFCSSATVGASIQRDGLFPLPFSSFPCRQQSNLLLTCNNHWIEKRMLALVGKTPTISTLRKNGLWDLMEVLGENPSIPIPVHARKISGSSFSIRRGFSSACSLHFCPRFLDLLTCFSNLQLFLPFFEFLLEFWLRISHLYFTLTTLQTTHLSTKLVWWFYDALFHRLPRFQPASWQTLPAFLFSLMCWFFFAFHSFDQKPRSVTCDCPPPGVLTFVPAGILCLLKAVEQENEPWRPWMAKCPQWRQHCAVRTHGTVSHRARWHDTTFSWSQVAHLYGHQCPSSTQCSSSSPAVCG